MAATQQQSSPSVLAVPIQTATPRRGPSRFLKVLCPISNPTPGPYAEPDEYISDSIDDEPATPFAPLQNVSFCMFFITFVYIILTNFNLTRKIDTFVCIILTDFKFTRKIVTIVCIILIDFNFTRKLTLLFALF